MFLKVIALIAFLGACQAVEHAYSSQSIVRFDSQHDEHHGHQEHHGHEEHHGHKEHHGLGDYHGHDEHHDHDEHEHEHNGHIEHKFEHHGHVEHKAEHKIEHNYEHKVEHNVEHKVEPKKEHKVELKKDNSGHQEHKYEHHVRVIPVVEKHEKAHLFTKVVAPVKVVPVAHYVHRSHKEESHHHHEPAISSQHISRHDVPAHPPKDFDDQSGPAKYEFVYQVKDPHTGDHKYQHESRNGHVVKGVYSLHEADGSVRTVEYGSDKHAGFSAAVKQTTKHVEEHKHHH